MTNDKILPNQQRIMDMLKEKGLSPTGRIVRPEPELQNIVPLSGKTINSMFQNAFSRSLGKTILFMERYNNPNPFPDKLLRMQTEYLRVSDRDCTPTEEWLGELHEQDFNKAKTPKKQLEARLHKKDKPKVSSLLAKLVKKT
jgi:hypothetical protein